MEIYLFLRSLLDFLIQGLFRTIFFMLTSAIQKCKSVNNKFYINPQRDFGHAKNEIVASSGYKKIKFKYLKHNAVLILDFWSFSSQILSRLLIIKSTAQMLELWVLFQEYCWMGYIFQPQHLTYGKISSYYTNLMFIHSYSWIFTQ